MASVGAGFGSRVAYFQIRPSSETRVRPESSSPARRLKLGFLLSAWGAASVGAGFGSRVACFFLFWPMSEARPGPWSPARSLKLGFLFMFEGVASDGAGFGSGRGGPNLLNLAYARGPSGAVVSGPEP